MTKVARYYDYRKRPRSVTIMIWGIIIVAIANGWRAIGLGQQADLLLTLNASFNPWVGLGFAFVWSIIFIFTAIALRQHRTWTKIGIPLLLLIHGIYQVLLVIIFARSNASRNGWPLIGLLFVLAVIFSVWALNRPSVRWFFN